MATSAAYASTPLSGSALVQIGDITRSGAPVAPILLVTAGASGSRIDNIDVEAVGSTSGGTVRIWQYNGATYSQILPEISLAATTAASSTPTPAASGYMASVSGNQLPIVLPSGSSLYATISDSQIIAPAIMSSIAATSGAAGTYYVGTPSVTAPVVTTAASTAAIAASASTNGVFTLTSTTVTATVPTLVSLTAAGNASATTFTIVGTRKDGSTLIETLAGPNTTTVYSANVYATVTGIISSGAPASAVSAGWAAVTSFPVPTKVMLSSVLSSNSGINVTLIGANGQFVKQTEVLAGPGAAATALSVNQYSAIYGYTLSATASNLQIGNPSLLGGAYVTARGGSF